MTTSGSRYDRSPNTQRPDCAPEQVTGTPGAFASRGGRVTLVCWPATSTPGTSLPSGRLWFGKSDLGFQLARGGNALFLTRNATRVYSAGSNPLDPGVETQTSVALGAPILWLSNTVASVWTMLFLGSLMWDGWQAWRAGPGVAPLPSAAVQA